VDNLDNLVDNVHNQVHVSGCIRNPSMYLGSREKNGVFWGAFLYQFAFKIEVIEKSGEVTRPHKRSDAELGASHAGSNV
jgi:hypothetical protein